LQPIGASPVRGWLQPLPDGNARVAGDDRASGAAVGEHLAHPLVLPPPLAGAGGLPACRASRHLLTNLAIVGKLLPAAARVAEAGANRLIEVEAAQR